MTQQLTTCVKLSASLKAVQAEPATLRHEKEQLAKTKAGSPKQFGSVCAQWCRGVPGRAESMS